MFTPEFITQLVSAIADEVVNRLEQRAQVDPALQAWLSRYGETMTRQEVAGVMKISTRQVQNMEYAGAVRRVSAPGKRALYDTAQIFQLMQTKSKRYANH